MAGESTLYQEKWDARVIQVYQRKGFLTKGMSTGPSQVVGKKMHFPILGKGQAQAYTRGDQVKVMNLVKGEVTLDAEEWDAADYIYQYDLDRMAPTMQDALVESCAMALGRKHDEVLYAKLQATDFNTPGQVVGAFNASYTLLNFMQARRKLFNADVSIEDGQNFCGIPPIVFDHLMSFNAFSNSQWVGPDLPWASGIRRRTFQNIHCFELPVHLQSVSGTDGKFYMWHKSALGTGYTGEEMRTGWEWQLSFKRHYYQSTISAGSTLIQSTGIVECRYKSDNEPTFT